MKNKKERSQANKKREADKQAVSLADLPLSDEQAENAKAGNGSHGGGAGAGKVAMQDYHFVAR